MASHSPIWVKITDFGISKHFGSSALRTQCGTIIYQAPELLGFLSPGMVKTTRSYTKNVDIWAFGALLHEVLTSEIPFLEQALPGDSILDSYDSSPPPISVNMGLLFGYCHGQPFPITTLQHNRVSADGIDFVKSLMTANPMNRVSAADALNARWFAENPGSEPTIAGPLQQCMVVVKYTSQRMRPAESSTSRAPPLQQQTQDGELTIRPKPFAVAPSLDHYPTGSSASKTAQIQQEHLPRPVPRTVPKEAPDPSTNLKPIILIRWVSPCGFC